MKDDANVVEAIEQHVPDMSGYGPCPFCGKDTDWLTDSEGNYVHWGPGGEQTSTCPRYGKEPS